MLIHYWSAFWIVVCLGLIQIVATYYGGLLTVESLPLHIPDARRRRHRRVFFSLALIFACLTLLLAKLNDANQYRSELIVEQERTKQEALQAELKQTFDTVSDSQLKLQQIKVAVNAHPPGAERSAMLGSIDQVESNLQKQANMMKPQAR